MFLGLLLGPVDSVKRPHEGARCHVGDSSILLQLPGLLLRHAHAGYFDFDTSIVSTRGPDSRRCHNRFRPVSSMQRG